MDDLSRFCCQNSECLDYGKRGGENLSVCDRYGLNKQRRMLRCRTCKARFSERKGTPLFGATLPEEKIYSLLEHIDEGCGIRETGRLVASIGHGDALQPIGGRPRPRGPRRTRGLFRTPGRCSRRKVVLRGRKHCDPADPGTTPSGR
jgi:hypothetical protein